MYNMETKVIYKDRLHILIGGTGTVWKEPETGTTIIEEDGIEYDITDYIEDTGWIIVDYETGKDSVVYKSECKII